MAQRVLIAMAMGAGPRLLVADEPTSGLDVTIQAQFLDEMSRTSRAAGSAVLLMTQDLGIIANYCDRVMVMQDGPHRRIGPRRRRSSSDRPTPADNYSRTLLSLAHAPPPRAAGRRRRSCWPCAACPSTSALRGSGKTLAGGRSRRPHHRAGRDAGAGRRKRLRQDHRRPLRAAPAGRRRRRSGVRGQGPVARHAAGVARHAPPHADRLPGSARRARPALDRDPHPGRGVAATRSGRGSPNC